MTNQEIKKEVKRIAGGERVRVCADKRGGYDTLLVFLPKSVRLNPERMAEVEAVMTKAGRVTMQKATRVIGKTLGGYLMTVERVPLYAIEPTFEPTAEELASAR